MTTIAAVKKEKRLCLASDTLTIFGSRKEVADKHTSNSGKIFQIGENCIASSGHPSWSLILQHYFSNKKKKTKWSSSDEIFETFLEMHSSLKKSYHLNPPQLQFLPFESSEFHLLIINSHGIFEIDYSRTVRQFSHFCAIGSGEEYALGAMRAVFDDLDDPFEIAKIGIEAAAEFDRKTALPLDALCIDLI
jgi:ATP-dependent protease HslVU (ClpYQ) peptidase subunit